MRQRLQQTRVVSPDQIGRGRGRGAREGGAQDPQGTGWEDRGRATLVVGEVDPEKC